MTVHIPSIILYEQVTNQRSPEISQNIIILCRNPVWTIVYTSKFQYIDEFELKNQTNCRI